VLYAGGQPAAVGDLTRGDAQPLPQRIAHRSDRALTVGRVSQLTEDPVHQPAIDALLSLQSVGDLNPKVIAHQIRRRLSQHLLGGINGIQRRADLLPRRYRTQS
jgi:hypothetical protein